MGSYTPAYNPLIGQKPVTSSSGNNATGSGYQPKVNPLQDKSFDPKFFEKQSTSSKKPTPDITSTLKGINQASGQQGIASIPMKGKLPDYNAPPPILPPPPAQSYVTRADAQREKLASSKLSGYQPGPDIAPYKSPFATAGDTLSGLVGQPTLKFINTAVVPLLNKGQPVQISSDPRIQQAFNQQATYKTPLETAGGAGMFAGNFLGGEGLGKSVLSGLGKVGLKPGAKLISNLLQKPGGKLASSVLQNAAVGGGYNYAAGLAEGQNPLQATGNIPSGAVLGGGIGAVGHGVGSALGLAKDAKKGSAKETANELTPNPAPGVGHAAPGVPDLMAEQLKAKQLEANPSGIQPEAPQAPPEHQRLLSGDLSNPAQVSSDLVKVATEQKDHFVSSVKDVAKQEGAQFLPKFEQNAVKADKTRIQDKIQEGGKVPTDALRSTMIIQSPHDAPGIIQAMEDKGYHVWTDPTTGRPDITDRFQDKEKGYKDIAIKFTAGPNDPIVKELQLVQPAMYEAKSAVGHTLYKATRGKEEILAAASPELRASLEPHFKATEDYANARYHEAYLSDNPSVRPSSSAARPIATNEAKVLESNGTPTLSPEATTSLRGLKKDLSDPMLAKRSSSGEALKAVDKLLSMDSSVTTPSLAQAERGVNPALPTPERPSAATELAGNVKTELANEGGFVSVGKDQSSTPALDTLHEKVISGVPEKSKFTVVTNKAKTTGQKVRTELSDRLAPIQNLSRAYEKLTGQKLSFQEDPYKLGRLYSGVPDRVKERIDEFGSIIRQAPDAQGLKDYGTLNRILTDRSGIKNPLTQEQAQAAMDELKTKLGPEKFQQTEETAKKVYAFHDEMLKYMRDGGIISSETFDRIKESNQNYFAKFDVVDHLLENSDQLSHGRSFNVAEQDLIKKQEGTEKNIADPIESTIRQTGKAIDLVERNRVGQAVARMASDPHMVEAGIARGLKPSETVPAGYEKISTFTDGVKEDYAVPHDVGEAFKNLNAKQADTITKIASKQTGILRMGATGANAGFMFISNPIRDAKTLAFNSSHIPVYRLVDGWLQGMYSGLGLGKVRGEFLASGGGQSTFFGKTAEQISKYADNIQQSKGERLVKTVINPKRGFGVFPAIGHIGQAVELAPRLAEYKFAKKSGLSPEEAAFKGRDVTVDFSKAGHIGKVANQWVPFLNARLQGTLKSLAAAKEHPGRAAVVATAMIGLPTYGIYAWNRQNFSNEYNQIPQYVKDSNYVIIYGHGHDKAGNLTQVIKIPKSDVDKIFANTLESALDNSHNHNPQKFLSSAVEALSNSSPIDFARNGKLDPLLAAGAIMPPVLKALIEGGTNHSFFRGAPLVGQSKSNLPANEQVNPNTSFLAKEIGKLTGQSPIKIDNAIQDTTGGLFNIVLNPGKATVGRLSGAPGNNVENQYYSVLAKTPPLRASASKQITATLKSGNEGEARRIADRYNQKLIANFSAFQRQFGPQESQKIKDSLKAQQINLSKASIKARERSKTH